MMLKRGLAWLMGLLILVGSACALGETRIAEVSTEIGGHYVRYPQLEGMQDEALQSRINDDIVLSSGISNHLVTLVTLGQNPWKLQVDHQSCLLEDRIFSTVISAKGRIGNQRDAHQYTAGTYDLATGEKIALDELFTDVEAAVELMEELAQESLMEEWNGYLEYSDLTPLPRDSFTLDETGITFWYPAKQFSFLSGHAGAVQFWYEELHGLWKENRVEQETDQQQRIKIVQSVEEGIIPGVPVAMGQTMQEVTEIYRLLRTPDEFPGGRYFVLEDPAFRSILVISDALESRYVEGIQLKRGGLHGLMIGKTSRQEWQDVLGIPMESVTVTENMAYDYRLPMGEYDVYHFGAHELRLHADEAGILCAIQLCNK